MQKSLNRNATNYEKLNEFRRKQEETRLFDKEVLQSRIQDNLAAWELMTKYKGQPYNATIAGAVKQIYPTRVLACKNDLVTNEKVAYLLAKHLVNSGVAPSKIAITTLEQCYLSIRGFGDFAEIKRNVFNRENQLIIIENIREIRDTDIKQNIYSFWEEFTVFLKQNKNVHVILVFESEVYNPNTNQKMHWFPTKQEDAENEVIRKLGFRSL